MNTKIKEETLIVHFLLCIAHKYGFGGFINKENNTNGPTIIVIIWDIRTIPGKIFNNRPSILNYAPVFFITLVAIKFI